MFASLEKRASALGLAIFFSIVVVGKMFGGSLKGLIPLGACVASGVWLWMKEVVRSGREVEWSSEQSRGETVGEYSAKIRYVLTPFFSRLSQTCCQSLWSG